MLSGLLSWMRSVDSSMKGCALKTLFLPMAVVALGVLAALPFRHSAQVESEAPAAADNALAEQAKAVTFPSTVAPLEIDSSNSAETASRLLTQLKPLVANEPEAKVPNFDTLPQSYDDIAVPLADRDTAKNLLKKNPANLAETSLAGNQWTFDRFGIPRPASELQNEVAVRSESLVSATPSATWSPARPIVDRTPPELMLASELKDQQKQQAFQGNQLRNQQLAQQSTSLEAAEAAATEAANGAQDSGVFQAVKDTRVKLRKPAAEAAGQLQNSAEQHMVAEPAERKRFWIHEPVKKSS